MNVEQIRDARNARPFGRFTLELDDGKLLPVEQPYYLGISPQGKELTYGAHKGGFQHYPVSKVVRLIPGIVREKAG